MSERIPDPARPRTVLLRGGEVHSPADPFATAMVVEGDSVAWVGEEGAADSFADGVDEVVHLDGALVTPAFTDAHVHTTATGLALTGLDLAPATHLADALARVRAHATARPHDRVLLGHGWDATAWPEGRPPSRGELDEATGGRPLYLTRVDVHSAVVTTALLDLVPGLRDLAGFHADAPLTGDAHHAVRKAAYATLTPVQRADAQRAALARAASLGIGSVHECAGPEISGEDDFTALLALAAEGHGPRVVGYWAELVASAKEADRIRELGAAGAAGDLFADGSLGSHTAHLHAPYADAAHTGTAHLDAEAVAAHVAHCTEAGLQAGFHAIGDAALTTVTDGVRAAADRVGLARVRAARHRVEHAEMLTERTLAAFAGLALTASVQPAFDAAWGGGEGMYAARLGADRARTLNPYAALLKAGVPLALGSDSPVTPSTPGARSAPRSSTAPGRTASPPAPPSPPTPAAAGAPSAATTPVCWSPAPPPTTPSGAPVTWSSRRPTSASNAGRPTPAPAPRACPTSAPAARCRSASPPSSPDVPSSHGRTSDFPRPQPCAAAAPYAPAPPGIGGHRPGGAVKRPRMWQLLTACGRRPVGSAESTTGRPAGRFRTVVGRGWATGGVPGPDAVTVSQVQHQRHGTRKGSGRRGPSWLPGEPGGRCDPGGARTLSRQRLSVDPQPAGPRSARRAPGPYPHRPTRCLRPPHPPPRPSDVRSAHHRTTCRKA